MNIFKGYIMSIFIKKTLFKRKMHLVYIRKAADKMKLLRMRNGYVEVDFCARFWSRDALRKSRVQ
jgi:hypothetical protein